jgi:sugar-specific transcriptional regulator TrmB
MRPVSVYSTPVPREPARAAWTAESATVVPPRLANLHDDNFDLAAGLRLVGMPQRQARLYLALSRGPQTARHAAEIARLHRATAYRLLVRLLERGLIIGGGWSPQKFQAVPPELLMSRLEGFLREEADLCATLTGTYARWARAVPEGHDRELRGELPQVLPRRPGGNDLILAEIESARQTLDLVARPVDCTIPFRTSLLRTLGNLTRRGVRVRLLTDATPPDQRFVAALARDPGDSRRLLTRRHLAPVGAHYYLCDSRVAVRLPAFGFTSHLPGIAIAERDPVRVRAQVERFETLWAQASEPFGPARSTRAYAWNQAARLFEADRDATPARIAPYAVIHTGPSQPVPGLLAAGAPRL